MTIKKLALKATLDHRLTIKVELHQERPPYILYDYTMYFNQLTQRT